MAQISKRMLDDVFKKATSKTRISGGYNQLFNKTKRLRKFKYEENTESSLIFPLSLALPFNPYNLDDDGYNEDSRFFLPLSVESGWNILHELGKENPEIIDLVEDYLLIDAKDYADKALTAETMSSKDRYEIVKESLAKICLENAGSRKVTADNMDSVRIDDSRTLDAQWLEVKKQLEEIFECDLSHVKLVDGKIKINWWEAKGKALASLLKDWRKIEPYGDWTCKINIPSLNQYAMRRAIETEVDADGQRHFKGLLYQLSQLEQEFIKPEMKAVNDSMKKGGANYNLNKEQKSTLRKSVTSKACIGVPTYYSIITALYFKKEDDGIEAETLKRVTSRGVGSTAVWMACDGEAIKGYLKKLGNRYDRTPSFVEVKMTVGGEENPLDRVRNTMKNIAESEGICDMIPGFEKMYTEFRDDTTENKVESIIASIPEFSKIPDAQLLEAYQTILDGYDNELFRKEVVGKYGQLITSIDADLGEKLQRAYEKDKLDNDKIMDDEIQGFAKFQKINSSEEEVGVDETGREIEEPAEEIRHEPVQSAPVEKNEDVFDYNFGNDLDMGNIPDFN